MAGLIAALSPNLGVLVLSRVLLGIGTSAAYPAAMSLIRSEADRTGIETPAGVLSGLSIARQVIAVIGPTLGGLLIALGGWHLIFTINIPLALVCVTMGALWLPRSTRTRGAAAHLDYLGIALFTGTLITLMLFLMSPQVSRWYLLVLALVLGTAFVHTERRALEPFIDLRVIAGNRPLIATYTRQILAFVGAYSFLYGFTQWLEEGRGLSASHAGLLLLPLSLSAVLISILTGRSAKTRGKLVAGSTFLVLAAAAQLVVGPHTPIWMLAVLGAVAGLPQGLNGLANQTALYQQADPARMGSSAGLLSTCVYVGALISAAAQARFFHQGATTAGLHQLAIFLLVLAALHFLVTLAKLPD
jgi:MFS family permease